MSALIPRRRTDVANFKPEEARIRDVVHDARIEMFKRAKDWGGVEAEIEKKLDDQEDVVNWWRVTVHNGRPRKTVADSVTVLSVDEAHDLSGFTKKQISRWAKRLAKRAEYRLSVWGAAYKKAMGELNEASELVLQSISNEHYTPTKYIEAARRVMGSIDVDPASCDEAQKTIQAAAYFTRQTSGLAHPWAGNVWLNPPYGGLAQQFIDKLQRELSEGRTHAAIVLVNAHCTDTGWFQPLFNGVLCFTDHRINFYGDDSRSGSTHGSVFSYFGPDKDVFAGEFSAFGAVLARV